MLFFFKPFHNKLLCNIRVFVLNIIDQWCCAAVCIYKPSFQSAFTLCMTICGLPKIKNGIGKIHHSQTQIIGRTCTIVQNKENHNRTYTSHIVSAAHALTCGDDEWFSHRRQYMRRRRVVPRGNRSRLKIMARSVN